jgi:hypothetical protein
MSSVNGAPARPAGALSAAALADGAAPQEVSLVYVAAVTADFSCLLASAGVGVAARGAFGDVFAGEDAFLRARFAVKRLRDDAPWPPERSAAREVAVLTQFRHPNLVRLYGYTVEPHARCLLYELGEAGALSGALAERERAAALTWHARVRVAAGVAAALNFLHRSGSSTAACPSC